MYTCCFVFCLFLLPAFLFAEMQTSSQSAVSQNALVDATAALSLGHPHPRRAKSPHWHLLGSEHVIRQMTLVVQRSWTCIMYIYVYIYGGVYFVSVGHN